MTNTSTLSGLLVSSGSLDHKTDSLTALHFFQTLFGSALELHGGWIVLVHGVGHDRRNEYFGDLLLAAERTEDLRLSGYEVLFGVNPRRLRTQKKAGISHVIGLHCDVDRVGAGGLHRLRSLYPTIIVESGSPNCYHPYWLFELPLDVKTHLKAIEALNRYIARQIFKLSQDAWDISRLLRVPGTINFKRPSRPRPVQILEFSNRRYTLESVSEVLCAKLDISTVQESPEGESAQNAFISRSGYLSREDRRYAERLLREGLFEPSSRHKAMLLVRYYSGLGYSADQTHEYVLGFVKTRNNNRSKDSI
jgi:hypothetical protein